GAHLHAAHQAIDERVAQEHQDGGDAHAAERRGAETADELRVDEADRRLPEHGRRDRPREARDLAQGSRAPSRPEGLFRSPPGEGDPSFQSAQSSSRKHGLSGSGAPMPGDKIAASAWLFFTGRPRGAPVQLVSLGAVERENGGTSAIYPSTTTRV